jgi:signal peptidase II
VDFIDLHYGEWHWPAFNLADSAIVFGAALIIWGEIRRKPA